MIAGLSYAQKLWNKGVDIGSVVVTSLVVGAIGLAFWRVKLWLDLRADERKQRQQKRISDEFKEVEQRQATIAYAAKMKNEREALASKMAASPDIAQMQDNWATYWYWLIQNRLDHLPQDRTIPQNNNDIRYLVHGGFESTREKTSAQILATELPDATSTDS